MMKGQNPSGVFLFKRDRPDMICAKYEKLLVPSKSTSSGGFIQPCGIAINAQFVFVCDKQLASVFKIDIVSEECVQKISMSSESSSPCRCSINQSYLILMDNIRRELRVVDINDISVIVGSRVLDLEPYDVLLTDDNLVIYKSGSDSGLIMTDVNFENQASFKNIKTSILGYTMLQLAGKQLLVIGTPCTTKMKHMFATYTVS